MPRMPVLQLLDVLMTITDDMSRQKYDMVQIDGNQTENRSSKRMDMNPHSLKST